MTGDFFSDESNQVSKVTTHQACGIQQQARSAWKSSSRHSAREKPSPYTLTLAPSVRSHHPKPIKHRLASTLPTTQPTSAHDTHMTTTCEWGPSDQTAERASSHLILVPGGLDYTDDS